MPHTARRRGLSGYYHVVPKGESDRLIFEDDRDRRRYLKELNDAKKGGDIRIHAYVLMSNHVHLAVESVNGEWEPIAAFIKQVNERYAMYFKRKAGRAGRVFQRHLWSEPIETDNYLLCAVRYIHANPAVAGICPASAYEWSSVQDYLCRGNGIADTGVVMEMLGGREGFILFSKEWQLCALPFPGSKLRGHLTDEEALCIAKRSVGVKRLEQFGGLPIQEQRGIVKKLRAAELSYSQISRMTGITRDRAREMLRTYQ